MINLPMLMTPFEHSAKCHVMAPDISIVALEDLTLFGSPLSDEAIPRSLEKKRLCLDTFAKRLLQIK